MPLNMMSLGEYSTTTQASSGDMSSLEVVGSYTVESSTSEVGYCEVIFIDQGRPREQVLPNHVSIEDIETRLSANPDMPRHLEEARKWVGATLYPNERSLRTLRLSRGLTQSSLARKIGTSQPHLARMEKGRDDIRRDTMRRLCVALGVDMNTLDEALQGSDGND